MMLYRARQGDYLHDGPSIYLQRTASGLTGIGQRAAIRRRLTRSASAGPVFIILLMVLCFTAGVDDESACV